MPSPAEHSIYVQDARQTIDWLARDAHRDKTLGQEALREQRLKVALRALNVASYAPLGSLS